MGRALRIQFPGAFYHITSRGNEQQRIFKNDTDREKFLSYLASGGTTEFVREIEETHLGQRKAHRDLPGIRQISGRWSIEAILAEVHKGVPGDEMLRKKISIYLCHHYSGARLREIGACFGIGESAISQEGRRFKRKLEKNGDLKKMVEQIRERLRGVNV